MKVTFEELSELAATIFECSKDELTLDSGLGHQSGWDSLAHVSLMVLLEDTYDVVIDETNIGGLLTIRQLLDFLNRE